MVLFTVGRCVPDLFLLFFPSSHLGPDVCLFIEWSAPVCLYLDDDDLIYCHLSNLSVGQTPRLCNLPSKSYSNNINVPYTGGNDLVKESGRPFNGMSIRF